MKRTFTAAVMLLIAQLAFTNLAQAQLTSLPDGANKRATVSEQIGITDVNIHYNRPAVKKREGHIWGELVPPGYVDQGFGTSKAAPWRAGANESTTIEFSTDVKIEGQALPAGKYGFFIAYDPNECTLIFSKNSTSWGSFFYKPEEDVLKVKVKPVAADKSVERLKYEFADQTTSSAIVELEWEKLVIPFKVDVDVVNTQLESFRKELRSDKGFLWQSWDQAAQFCAQHKVNLEEALVWTDSAVHPNFGGSQSFQTWSTRAMVLDSLGRSADAEAARKKALPFADMNELYFYGRTLITNKKGADALEVLKLNYTKHPNEYVATIGLARGYSAVGDYKKALTYVQKAQPLATSKPRQDMVEKAIKTLQDGKDIN
ncbi:MAG TPA: DUF2911 domain-containing protein [Mucilaginibacter sp.]|nr:DUF2911 domain-containing protein [Mucilaginibacter sp.]